MAVWQNPDQERTSQNARIFLKTILPYNKYGLLTKREVKMAGFWLSSFFARV